jgi:hypothetical protein
MTVKHINLIWRKKMKRLLVALIVLILCAGVSVAQKGKAEPDYYPLGYSGDTWTGKVTAFDNERRILTLTHASGKDVLTFIASIPDAPYEWSRDARNSRVLDFPYNKGAKYQTFKYEGHGDAGSRLPDMSDGMQRRPSPPASNVISDLAGFMNKDIIVYYTPRDRKVNGVKEKYNDVWRILILSAKKK